MALLLVTLRRRARTSAASLVVLGVLAGCDGIPGAGRQADGGSADSVPGPRRSDTGGPADAAADTDRRRDATTGSLVDTVRERDVGPWRDADAEAGPEAGGCTSTA